MASTYSTNLRLELIGTGEQQGSWGVTTNTNLGTLIEDAIAGYVAVPVTDGADTTLTVSNGAADQSRNMTLNFTGALTAARNVIAPAIEKIYLVKNSTTGGFAVTLKVSGQTGVSIPNGSTVLVYVDGTDVRYLTGSFASYGPVPVTSATNTFTASQVINVTDNTSAALRITQLGTGNALLVEDSANPDSTPFVIDASGNVVVGNTTAVDINGTPQLQVAAATPVVASSRFSADTSWSRFRLTKSRSATVGTNTIVQNGDGIGQLEFLGADGSSYSLAASIGAYVDGAPGVGDMPGRLVFLTTPDGSSAATERMRIDSNGNVGIGGTPLSYNTLAVAKAITGGADAFGVYGIGVVQSDVTSSASYFVTGSGTAAAAFTLSNMYHFRATQGTFGAGSTVSSQYGFFGGSTLIGATNNYAFGTGDTSAVTAGKTSYGFYSAINTATGGGTTWAFYGNGTANSYFGGSIGIGTTGSLTTVNVNMAKAITGGTTAYGYSVGSTVQSDVTAGGIGFRTNLSTAAAAFTVTNLTHFLAEQSTIGASSTVTNQNGFFSGGSLIGGTSNFAFYAGNTAAVTSAKTAYGFYSAVNVATGGGTTWAFYGNGTANSYFGGSVGIGTTALTGVNLYVSKNITGGTTSYGIASYGAIQSDVTANGFYFSTSASTAAAAFTLATLAHYRADQGTFGASSSVTSQYGFFSTTTLIGATGNYGFFAANTAGVTTGKTAYGFYSGINVATGGGTTWAYYGAGTAWSFFAGPVILDDVHWMNTPAPTAKSTTATLTGAEVKTQMVTLSGTSYTVTMPTGTNLDAEFSGIPATVDIGFDLTFINTASGTVTIAVNTGITSVGTLTIATGVSATFRLRRTAANTYIMYRVA